MRVTTRQRRKHSASAGLAFTALALAAALSAAPASAAPTGASGASGAAPKPVKIRLKTHQEFTPTGVTVKPGDTVAITTSGTIVFGGGLRDAKTPVGIAWGKDCDAIFKNQVARKRPWPAPGLRCWSMIGRVGSGPIFEVGTAKTFRATEAGDLSLGVNDNFVRDNQGFWFATIKVNPPGAVATPTTPASKPATPPTPKKKSSSNTMMFVLIGALLLLVILLVIFVLARRRGNDKEEPEPELVGAAVGASAAAAAPVATPVDDLAMSAGPTGAAPLPESIDVNIFEVEFSNGLTLRVGYNHFPEGVDLRWKVTQNRIPVATGRFTTEGGGSTNHYETIPLGLKLEGRDTIPDGADVQFDWTLNDVPFRYSVRRDPNC